MQTRHRIPTIFNLSMVDVLCCALGCVILLWLVYFKEARERSLAAGETNKHLTATKLKLDDVLRDLNATQLALSTGQQKNEYLSGQLLEVTGQRDQVLTKWDVTDKEFQAALKNLKEAQSFVAALKNDVKDLDALNKTAKAIAAQKSKEYSDLASQYLAATQGLKDLEKLVGDQKGVLAVSAAKTAELQAKLTEAEKKAAKLEQQVGTFQTLSTDYGQQLAKIEARTSELEKDLDKRKADLVAAGVRYEELLKMKNLLDQNLASTKGNLTTTEKALAEAKQANAGLAGNTKALSDQLNQLRSATENRFAGIELTGSRVVFLVDMSGSMRMKDNYFEDPAKWPMACDVLGKLIKSLPDLKQFQVILFSDKVRYPLANEGKWHDYRGEATIKNVLDAVRAEVPQNATNMYTAMEETFKYRALGMDTIYLLSDGLPNEGEGVPASAAKLTDDEKSILLAKHVRNKLKTTWNAPTGTWIKQRVRINTIGFYFDSPDVGSFLWALARDNDGSFVGLSKP